MVLHAANSAEHDYRCRCFWRCRPGARKPLSSSDNRLPPVAYWERKLPYGLNIVRPAELGTGFRVIVSAFMAVMLFEGALTLRPELIRQALSPVRRLITVGAGVTL